MIKTVWYLLLCTALQACSTDLPSQIPIPLEDFEFESRGAYRGRLDPRQIFQIEHPLTRSKAEDFGEIKTVFKIPPGASPPYFLSFYVSDNNQSKVPESTGGLMVDTRVGHRFQRCLINGQEVWMRDTSLIDSAIPRIIDITPFVEENEFELRLGLFDRVDSSEQLPGDVLKDPQARFHVDSSKYETRSYWGNVVLHCGSRPEISEQLGWPFELDLKRPDFPGSNAVSREILPLEKAELLRSRWAWPVVQGIPLPESSWPQAPRLRLSHPAGDISVGTQGLSKWQDTSTKWVLARFTLAAESPDDLTLHFSPSEETSEQARHPVSTTKKEHSLCVSNGLIRLRATHSDGADLDWTISGSGGEEVLSGMHLSLQTTDGAYPALWRKVTVFSSDAWHTELLAEGTLQNADGRSFGTCRIAATVFADVPYVRLLTTVRKETPGLSRTKDLTLHLRSPLKVGNASPSGSAIRGNESGGLLAVIRYFSNLRPIAIFQNPAGIECRFVSGANASPLFHAGEEVTYETWLAVTGSAVSSEDAKAFAALVETPPRLNSSRLIRESRVWGDIPEVTAQTHPVLFENIINASLKPYFSRQRKGARVFGNYSGFTQNFYWNSLHTLYAMYAMTGNREWYDWAERSSRHLMDVLIRHWDANGKGLGGQYLTLREDPKSVDAGTFSVRLQLPHGFLDHWQMTGESRGRTLAMGMVDFLMTDPEMISSAQIESSRHQGWALLALMRGWNETYDPAILEYAGQLAAVARSHIEPRRGAYREVHGNFSFRGIVPFMNGNLLSGLREYYQATGDPHSGEAIVKIAWAVYSEMHNPHNTLAGPGIDYEYSPNPYHRESPRFKPSAVFNPAIVAGQAYAACISDDRALADVAKRGWEAFLREEPAVMTPQACYDLAAAIFWLNRAEAADHDQ